MEYLFSFNDDARVTVTCDGQSFFEQNPICLPDGYAITGQADGFLLAKTDAAAESVLPDIKITSEPIENGLRIFLESASDPDTPDAVNLAYPAPFAVHSDDEIALPFYEGILFRADELPPPVPKQLGCPGGSSVSMGFWGVLRGGSWLMTAVITNADAGVSLLPKSDVQPQSTGVQPQSTDVQPQSTSVQPQNDDNAVQPGVVWFPQLGKWGGKREIRYLAGKGGLTELCVAYRAIAIEKGFYKPFTEKVKELPDIDRLLAAANVWLWNDDGMDKLYSSDDVYRVPTDEQKARRLEIARDMKSLGMERVLWSVFDENVDAALVDKVKDLGYLTTYYDIYTDVIPHTILDKITPTRVARCRPRLDYWKKGIIENQDGSLATAWQLKGKDGIFYYQNRMCDVCAVECAEREAPKHEKDCHLDGRFIDVTFGHPSQCWSKVHPMTRADSLENKRKLFRMLKANGMFCGTEVGCEEGAAVFDYNEGLISPNPFRAADAGRRMATVYYGADVPENTVKYMLNPRLRVPMWELVYHNCVQSYWYWGDSANHMPEYTHLRSLFCRLWGLPHLFSFNAGNWEKLRDTVVTAYRETTPYAREVAYQPLDRWEKLDNDGYIQKTVFGNGVTVLVNFSDRSFTTQDGTTVPAQTAINV